MFTHLKEIRLKSGLTCEDMSEIIGLKTRSAYHKKESGLVPFKLDEAYKVARYFKRSIESIFYKH